MIGTGYRYKVGFECPLRHFSDGVRRLDYRAFVVIHDYGVLAASW